MPHPSSLWANHKSLLSVEKAFPRAGETGSKVKKLSIAKLSIASLVALKDQVDRILPPNEFLH
jgi:hypothetical protein